GLDFRMGADVWRAAAQWPPAHATGHSPYLPRPAGPGRTPGRLGPEPGPAASAAADDDVHDPADPIPSRGGRVLHRGRLTPGPLALSRTATRSDVLLYLGDVLAEDLDVIGEVRLRLTFATDAADADLMARLVNHLPDGRLLPVCEGVVRLSHRDGPGTPVPRGEPIRLDVGLGHTAQRFRAGHRVGLMLSSSNFPHYDRNQGDGRPSTQSVHYGTSVLILGGEAES